MRENINMNIQDMACEATNWVHVVLDPFPGPCKYSNEFAVSTERGEFN
jgi:hypothetical protein